MPKTYTLGEAKRILRMREKQQDEFIKERLTDEVKERLLGALTPEQLRSIGKRYQWQGKKDLKRAELSFLLADLKEKKQRRLEDVAAETEATRNPR